MDHRSHSLCNIFGGEFEDDFVRRRNYGLQCQLDAQSLKTKKRQKYPLSLKNSIGRNLRPIFGTMPRNRIILHGISISIG